VELQGRYTELQKLGLEVAAFTYDQPELIKKFTDDRKIEFPVLSDHDHTIVERYGLLNRQFEPGHRLYGIPHPGTFILSREGRVLARYFEEEYQYRNTAASIALKIGQPVTSMGPPSRQATRDLDLTAFLTDETVAPGHRFSIVVDITPKAGRRIVAPGPHSYRVVALAMEAGDLLRLYPVSYPASAELRLTPSTARVPVYRDRFRLIQDLAVVVNDDTRARAKEPGSTVTLKGVLEYQVCTDQACDAPQQVPMSWTVQLKPLG